MVGIGLHGNTKQILEKLGVKVGTK